jgi:hypothetical protein
LNSRPLDPQTSAACLRTSTNVQFSLKIRILHLGDFGGQTQMVVKMVVKAIAKLSEEACSASGGASPWPQQRRRRLPAWAG